MKIPPPSPEAIASFERLRPKDPRISVRKMFGQPAAFLNGHLFFGVYGPDVFVRLPGAASTAVDARAELRPFEPMPGRPMHEYFVLPRDLAGDPKRSGPLLRRSVELVLALPPKPAKGRRP